MDAFAGAGVSSEFVARTGDWALFKMGASLTAETMIWAELVLVENAEAPPATAVVA
jgi:hypothetical protein